MHASTTPVKGTKTHLDGSRDCIVTYLYVVGAYESHDSPFISESSLISISEIWFDANV